MSNHDLRFASLFTRRAALIRGGAIAVSVLLGGHRGGVAAEQVTPLASAEATGKYATINGVDLYFVERGDPAGQPILMLHGGLGNSENWDLVWPALADSGYRVLLLDSRRHGRSGWGDQPLSFELSAADAVGLLDHLALSRVDLIGWSDGAITGLELAINHRERLRNVVAYGANFTPDGLLLPDESDAFATLVAQMAADYARLSPQPERFGDLFAELGALYETAPDFREDQLRGITTPFLVLDGATDELVKPDQPVRLAALIPGSTLQIMPDTGHFAPLEQPAAFTQIVLNFLLAVRDATPTTA